MTLDGWRATLEDVKKLSEIRDRPELIYAFQSLYDENHDLAYLEDETMNVAPYTR